MRVWSRTGAETIWGGPNAAAPGSRTAAAPRQPAGPRSTHAATAAPLAATARLGQRAAVESVTGGPSDPPGCAAATASFAFAVSSAVTAPDASTPAPDGSHPVAARIDGAPKRPPGG